MEQHNGKKCDFQRSFLGSNERGNRPLSFKGIVSSLSLVSLELRSTTKNRTNIKKEKKKRNKINTKSVHVN